MRPLLGLLALSAAFAQGPSNVRAWHQAHQREILTEFEQLVAIPNVAADPAGLQRNAAHIQQMMQRRGIQTRLLTHPGTPSVIFGELNTPGATRTLTFYAHYDGQPVNAKEWTGGDPFHATLRSASLEKDGQVLTSPYTLPLHPEWRLYGRSTSDDKAPILALMAALDALRASRTPLKSNIKFFFEGEEEAGSPHLADIVRANKALLKSDVWLICDGPVHQSRQQQIYFGARGVTGLELTVYGPRRELHSGHYGNWAPNPAMRLAQLLATMKDDSGRVLVEHFYDGIAPLSPTEKTALAQAPDTDANLEKELWLTQTDGAGRKLIDLMNEPSLNIRGLASVSVGAQSRNVIPATATASLDIRLVKGISPEQAIQRLRTHIEKQGYYIVANDPDAATRLAHPKVVKLTTEGGYPAARTSMDLPISRDVIVAAERARGPVVKMPTLGGSVPLYIFEDELHAPFIGIPIANHDNSQHSFNENLRLQNLWDGIELMAGLLTM